MGTLYLLGKIESIKSFKKNPEPQDPLLNLFKKEKDQYIDLRKEYAKKLYNLLDRQLVILNAIFLTTGLGWLTFPKWLLEVFITGIVIEAFAIVHTIIKSIFPTTNNQNYVNWFKKQWQSFIEGHGN